MIWPHWDIQALDRLTWAWMSLPLVIAVSIWSSTSLSISATIGNVSNIRLTIWDRALVLLAGCLMRIHWPGGHRTCYCRQRWQLPKYFYLPIVHTVIELLIPDYAYPHLPKKRLRESLFLGQSVIKATFNWILCPVQCLNYLQCYLWCITSFYHWIRLKFRRRHLDCCRWQIHSQVLHVVVWVCWES